jgi:hypothetical protein
MPFDLSSADLDSSLTNAAILFADMPLFNKELMVALPKLPVAPVIKIIVFVLNKYQLVLLGKENEIDAIKYHIPLLTKQKVVT